MVFSAVRLKKHIVYPGPFPLHVLQAPRCLLLVITGLDPVFSEARLRNGSLKGHQSDMTSLPLSYFPEAQSAFLPLASNFLLLVKHSQATELNHKSGLSRFRAIASFREIISHKMSAHTEGGGGDSPLNSQLSQLVRKPFLEGPWLHTGSPGLLLEVRTSTENSFPSPKRL